MKLKHLLVMAAMAVFGCGSAWAQNQAYYSNDYSDGEVRWTTSTSGRYTPVIFQDVEGDASTNYLSVTQGERQNNGCTLTTNETVGCVTDENGNFTMSCRVKLGASNNQANTLFKIWDKNNANAILQLAEVTTNATKWTINGNSETKATVSAGNKGIADLSWVFIQVTYFNGKVYLTLKDDADNIIDEYSLKPVTALSTVGGLGKITFDTSRYNANFAIDDILVRPVNEETDIPASPSHNYTVNAVCGSVILKEIAAGTVSEDEPYSVVLSNTIEKDGQYYVLSGTNSNVASFTMGKADATNEVAYVLDNQIAYFTELEDLNFTGSNYTVDEMSGFSNGKGRSIHRSDVSMDIPFTINEPGIFNIQIPYKNTNNRDREHVISIKKPNGETTELSRRSVGANGGNGVENIEVALAEAGEYTISILCTYNLTATIDYMKVSKVAAYNGGEIVGAINMSTPENGAYSSDITLVKGETKTITFQNHGQDYGKNWRIRVKEGETVKSVTRADSWDETAGAATKVAYTQSVDGGATKGALNWDTYAAAMADAECVAVLAYGENNVLSITTTSQNGQYISYVDQDVTMSGTDATINLSVCNSWLEIKDIKSEGAKATITLVAKAGDYYYATFSTDKDVEFENAVAYTVEAEGEDLTLTPVADNKVPANTGVLIKTTNETETYSTVASAPALSNNMLKAASVAMEAGFSFYKLAYDNYTNKTGLGFYYGATDGAAFTCKAGTAYLAVPASSSVKSFVFDDDATAIKSVSISGLDASAPVYNVAGQRVNANTKGIVIQNGKKYFNK